jgi:hypothetical protein
MCGASKEPVSEKPVMQDSSPFRWLEDCRPACQLIAQIDVATRRIGGQLNEHDIRKENLRTLEGWLRRYGRPLAHYTDKNGVGQKAGLRSRLRSAPAPLAKTGAAVPKSPACGLQGVASYAPPL